MGREAIVSTVGGAPHTALVHERVVYWSLYAVPLRVCLCVQWVGLLLSHSLRAWQQRSSRIASRISNTFRRSVAGP
jgi:hypothetical protein